MEFPLGYRFCPTDQELVVHYLKRKILSQSLPFDIIPQVDLYQYGHPKHFQEKFMPLNAVDSGKEKQYWYFFTLLKHKHFGGKRPSRVTGVNEGSWKATGTHDPIKDDRNRLLGYKRTFCYYQNNGKSKQKTTWIMHEFSIDDNTNLVLCRIHCRSEISSNSGEVSNAAASQQLNIDPTMESNVASQQLLSTDTVMDMECDTYIRFDHISSY